MAEDEVAAKVFVCYAREDFAFVRDELSPALAGRGVRVMFDQQDIEPGERWKERIHVLIAEGDAILVVLSPEADDSMECAAECEKAAEFGKRMVPIVRRDVSLPPRLPVGQLQFTNWRDGDPAEAALDDLVSAVVADYEWVRQHAKLADAAATYAARPRSENLLRGANLRQAARWLARPPYPEPALGMRQRELIRASLLSRRRTRISVVAIVAAGLVVVGLLGWRVHDNRLARDRAEDIALAARLASDAEQAVARDDAELGALLARESYLGGLATDSAARTRADAALRAALGERPSRSFLAEDPDDPAGGGYTTIAVSPDGDHLVSVGGTPRAWDLTASPPRPRVLDGIDPTDRAVAFSGDGRFLAVGGEQGLTLFRLDDDLVRVEHTSQPVGFSVALDEAGDRLVASLDGGRVLLWDLSQGLSSTPREIEVPGQGRSVALSATGSKLAVGTFGGRVLLWDDGDFTTPARSERFGVALVGALAFTPDEASVVAGTEEDVELLDLSSGSTRSLGATESNVAAVAVSPDGALAAAGSGQAVRIWSLDDPSARPQVLRTTREVQFANVSFIAEGRELVTRTSDGEVRVWDLQPPTDDEVGTVPALFSTDDQNQVFAAAVDPEGELVATGGEAGRVRLWDRRGDPPEVVALSEEPVFAVAFSRDGETLAVGGLEGLWFIELSGRDPRVEHAMNDRNVRALAVSPDGRWLAVGDHEAAVELWAFDASADEPTHSWPMAGSVSGVAFGRDGGEVAATSFDRLRAWSVPDGEEVLTVAGLRVASIAYGPDDEILGARADGSLVTVGPDGTREVLTPRGEEGYFGGAIDVSPAGDRAVIGDAEGRLALWDVDKEQVMGELPRHEAGVDDVMWAPSGSWVVSAGEDGTARVSVTTDTLAERVCDLVWQNLSLAEWALYMGDEPYRRTCPDLPSGLGAPADADATFSPTIRDQ